MPKRCLRWRSAPALYWPPETPLEITTRTIGDVTVVALHGVFTADHGVREFAETMRRLIENGHARIVVNCQAMSQAADAWLTEMVRAYTVAARDGADLHQDYVRAQADWVLRLAIGYARDHLRDLRRDEAAAIASFGGEKV